MLSTRAQTPENYECIPLPLFNCQFSTSSAPLNSQVCKPISERKRPMRANKLMTKAIHEPRRQNGPINFAPKLHVRPKEVVETEMRECEVIARIWKTAASQLLATHVTSDKKCTTPRVLGGWCGKLRFFESETVSGQVGFIGWGTLKFEKFRSSFGYFRVYHIISMFRKCSWLSWRKNSYFFKVENKTKLRIYSYCWRHYDSLIVTH